jgi:hypothetical protein
MVSDATYELKMPFVVVTSVGGPYDDNAYVAGWEAKTIQIQLAGLAEQSGPLIMVALVLIENQPQIDLVAMQEGWTVAFEYADAYWVTATFKRAEADI